MRGNKPLLCLRLITWNGDSHGLFDFESNNLSKLEFELSPPRKDMSYFVLRTSPVDYSVVSDEEISSEETSIVCEIRISNGRYFLLQNEKSGIKLWDILRTRPKQTSILHVGDRLKLGRFEMRLREIVLSDSTFFRAEPELVRMKGSSSSIKPTTKPTTCSSNKCINHPKNSLETRTEEVCNLNSQEQQQQEQSDLNQNGVPISSLSHYNLNNESKNQDSLKDDLMMMAATNRTLFPPLSTDHPSTSTDKATHPQQQSNSPNHMAAATPPNLVLPPVFALQEEEGVVVTTREKEEDRDDDNDNNNDGGHQDALSSPSPPSLLLPILNKQNPSVNKKNSNFEDLNNKDHSNAAIVTSSINNNNVSEVSRDIECTCMRLQTPPRSIPLLEHPHDDEVDIASPHKAATQAPLSPMHGSDDANNVSTCRICLDEELDVIENPLIAPCSCRGSMAFVHLNCLRRWMEGRLKVPEDAAVATQAMITQEQQEGHHDDEGLNGADRQILAAVSSSSPMTTRTRATSFFFCQLSCELCKLPYPPSVVINGVTNDLLPLPRPAPPYVILEAAVTRQRSGLVEGLHVVSLASETAKLGRSADCEIRVNDISVSRLHATLALSKEDESALILSDCHSKFGSCHLLPPETILHPSTSDNDVFYFQAGRTVFWISIQDPSSHPHRSSSSEGKEDGCLSSVLMRHSSHDKGEILSSSSLQEQKKRRGWIRRVFGCCLRSEDSGANISFANREQEREEQHYGIGEEIDLIEVERRRQARHSLLRQQSHQQTQQSSSQQITDNNIVAKNAHENNPNDNNIQLPDSAVEENKQPSLPAGASPLLATVSAPTRSRPTSPQLLPRAATEETASARRERLHGIAVVEKCDFHLPAPLLKSNQNKKGDRSSRRSTASQVRRGSTQPPSRARR
eukprot:GDKJ01003098.1.p1 GENE.GDKJ01003098.1~~GDKJ01003098.1.p1  ORF type:complete len:910 (+),score=232.05 GDKJ01003098.1:40-2769(+)